MPTRSRRLRLLFLALALPALAASAGCGMRLKYNTRARDAFTYTRTTFNGGTDGQGNPYIDDKPSGSISIIVHPFMNRGGNVWMRITTPTLSGSATVYGDKNLGEEQILLAASGKIMDRKQNNGTYSRYDLFFDLPKGRLKPGDSWASQQFHEVHRTIAISKSLAGEGQYFPLDYEKSLPVEYKVVDKVKCGRGKCARLAVSAAYEEVIEQEGAPIYATLSYSRTGTVDFNIKKGMVHSAVYDDVFYKQIVDSVENTVLMEANDVNRFQYAIKEP